MSVLSQLRSLAPRRIGLLSTRAYGSAAQLQYDYSEEEGSEDEGAPRQLGMAESEGWGWVPERGVQWVLMGDRGIKRHVYGERLSKLLQVPHISMGTLVRQELHPRSSLYKQVSSGFSNFFGNGCFKVVFGWELNNVFFLGNLMLFEFNLRLPLVMVTL